MRTYAYNLAFLPFMALGLFITIFNVTSPEGVPKMLKIRYIQHIADRSKVAGR